MKLDRLAGRDYNNLWCIKRKTDSIWTSTTLETLCGGGFFVSMRIFPLTGMGFTAVHFELSFALRM